MRMNPWFLTIYIAVILVIGVGLAVLLKRFWPKSAMGWTKLAARIGMVLATLYATGKVVTSLLPNGLLQVELHTAAFWPKMPNALHPYNEYLKFGVHGGGFDTATVYIYGANAAERLWISIGAVALSATVLAICIMADRIAIAVAQGAEFRAISAKWLRRTAVITVIGGEVAKIATDIGYNLIAMRLQNGSFGFSGAKLIPNPWLTNPGGVGNSYDQIFGHVNIYSGFTLSLELWPILVAIGLYVLARIFEAGRKFEADAEGLV